MVSIRVFQQFRARSLLGCRDTARAKHSLTSHHSHRLGDGVAFATSIVDKGKEACRQHLVVWPRSPRGYFRQPKERSKSPFCRGLRLRINFLAQTAVCEGGQVED